MLATTAFGNEKLSEALGHMIGKNFKSLEIPIDFDALVKGMKEEAAGLDSPLNEAECAEALSLLEEKSFLVKKEKNLQEAVAFLQTNEKKEGVVQLEDGKIQFEVIKKGEGRQVQPYNTPLVRCHGQFLNGELFTLDDAAERICLDEVLPGLKCGIVGMYEGEVRKLYIHPTLGYGEEDPLYPNSLLIFEVEVIEAVPDSKEEISHLEALQ